MVRNFNFYSLALFVVFITLPSCSATIGDPPLIPDPAFHGQWIDDLNTIDLRIAHDSGQLHAHGFNYVEGALWDKLTFTGTVTEIGFAEGIVQLWNLSGQGNEIMIAEFELELPRSGNSMTLNLVPLQESYVLQKQP